MTFDEWFNEERRVGTVLKLIENDFDLIPPIHIINWLRAAYDVGYEAGKEDKEVEFESRADIE